MSKTTNFITETVEVRWSHLHRPDDKFGADTSNHNITIVVDAALRKNMDEMMETMGANKINGMRVDDEGRTLLKAKTKWYVKKNVTTFPCVDAGAKETDALPFQGDKVKLKLSPIVIDRDNSMSFFLNGVQIIEKTDREATGGFESTEGFDGSGYKAPERAAKEETVDVPDQEGGDDLPF